MLTDRRAASALFVLALVVYNANLRVVSSGDTRPARYLPFAILGQGSLTLEDLEPQVTAGLPDQYWVTDLDGRLVSEYPVVTPLLVTPLYVPAVLYLGARGWPPGPLGFLAALMEKLASATVAALSAALMFLLLRRRAPFRDSILLTVAYAFGTNTWATSSQALWQHGAAQLLLIVALLAATGERSPGHLVLAGTCCGLLAANRVADILLAAPLILHFLLESRRTKERACLLAPAAGIGALLLIYHYSLFGRFLGGYFLGGDPSAFFQGSIPHGLAGLLASPGKGLLVFSPFLLFLLARPFVPAPVQDRRLDALLSGALLAQLLLYARVDWRGGWCYGPRYLVDLIPILIWLLVPVLARLGPAARAAFLVCVAAAIPIQAIGTFYYPHGESDAELNRDLASSWELRNAQFLLELRHGAAPLAAHAPVQLSQETSAGPARPTRPRPSGTPKASCGPLGGRSCGPGRGRPRGSDPGQKGTRGLPN